MSGGTIHVYRRRGGELYVTMTMSGRAARAEVAIARSEEFPEVRHA